jgi:hypothetical protein
MIPNFITLHRDSKYRVTESNQNTDTKTKSTGTTDVASRIVSEGKTPNPSSLSDSVFISLADSVLSSQCCVLPQITMTLMTHPNGTHRSRSNTVSKFGHDLGDLEPIWAAMSKCKAHDCIDIWNDLGDLGDSVRGCMRVCAPVYASARPPAAVPPLSKNRPNRPNRPKSLSRLLVSIWTSDSKSVQIDPKQLPNRAVATNGGISQ